jgi:hypothetical protein
MSLSQINAKAYKKAAEKRRKTAEKEYNKLTPEQKIFFIELEDLQERRTMPLCIDEPEDEEEKENNKIINDRIHELLKLIYPKRYA